MQNHKSQPLADFIEHPQEEMLTRANEFLPTSQRLIVFAALVTAQCQKNHRNLYKSGRYSA